MTLDEFFWEQGAIHTAGLADLLEAARTDGEMQTVCLAHALEAEEEEDENNLRELLATAATMRADWGNEMVYEVECWKFRRAEAHLRWSKYNLDQQPHREAARLRYHAAIEAMDAAETRRAQAKDAVREEEALWRRRAEEREAARSQTTNFFGRRQRFLSWLQHPCNSAFKNLSG